jgi:hypothetical protein
MKTKKNQEPSKIERSKEIFLKNGCQALTPILTTSIEGALAQSFEVESLLMGAPSPLGNDHLPSEAILPQNLASLYRLEPPFLGLT